MIIKNPINDKDVEITITDLNDGIAGRTKTSTPDNLKLYVIPEIPEWMYPGLIVHEFTEEKLEESGKSYPEAHKEATEAEREYVTSHDISWKTYDGEYKKALRKVEAEGSKIRNPIDLMHGDTIYRSTHMLKHLHENNFFQIIEDVSQEIVDSDPQFNKDDLVSGIAKGLEDLSEGRFKTYDNDEDMIKDLLQQDSILDTAKGFWSDVRGKFEDINKSLWDTLWSDKGQAAYEQGMVQTQIGVSGPVPVMEKYAQEYFDQHGLELVKTLSDTDIDRFKSFMADPANWNIPAGEFTSRLDDTWAVSDERASLIYENETHEAYVHGQHDYIDEQILPMGRTVMKTFHHSGNVHFRPEHLELDGETVPYEENYSNGVDGPGGPNCGCWEEFEVLDEETSKE